MEKFVSCGLTVVSRYVEPKVLEECSILQQFRRATANGDGKYP